MNLLSKPIDEAIFRVIDLETTGINRETDRVVEIAAVDLLPGGAPARPRAHLINPGCDIPPAASAIHHITSRMVADAPRLTEVVGEYVASDVVYVAHNAPFDSAFLPVIEGPWLCTVRLARHLLPEAPGHGNQILRYWLGLEELPDWTGGLMAHRALYDAACTALILGRLLERLKTLESPPATVEELLAFAARPISQNKIRFGKYRGKRYDELPTDYLRWMARTNDWGPDVEYAVQQQLAARGVADPNSSQA